jgi:hypothetical protein
MGFGTAQEFKHVLCRGGWKESRVREIGIGFWLSNGVYTHIFYGNLALL